MPPHLGPHYINKCYGSSVQTFQEQQRAGTQHLYLPDPTNLVTNGSCPETQLDDTTETQDSKEARAELHREAVHEAKLTKK